MRLSSIFGRLLLAVGLLAGGTGQAQNLAADPLVKQLTNRANWEPGGRYFAFDDRGTITSRSGQINTVVTSSVRTGNIAIQNAVISGHIGFVNSFSGHGYDVHSPFDNTDARSDSAKNQRADGSSTTVSLSWTGTEVHPANGYDGPQGGGYPRPAGARDIYNFTINGSANGVYVLSTAETQASELSPTKPDASQQKSLIDKLKRDIEQEYSLRDGFDNLSSPVGAIGTGAANTYLSERIFARQEEITELRKLAAQARMQGNTAAAADYEQQYKTKESWADSWTSIDTGVAFSIAYPSELISVPGLGQVAKGAKNFINAADEVVSVVRLADDVVDATKSLKPVVKEVVRESDGLADLAKLRSELNLKEGEGTLARLEIEGQAFYGVNAHGQPITMGVNAISRTHAEADAFQQALNAGTKGGTATLHVDRPLCTACGQNGGVRSMARQLGLDEVKVVTPEGTQIIRP